MTIYGRTFARIIAALYLTSTTDVAAAQSQQPIRFSDSVVVFQVHAFDCPGHASKRVQTGFIAGDPPGLVTTLHGVLGCKEIVADLRSKHKTFKLFEPQRVDIARDTVVYWSTDLEKEFRAGTFRIPRTVSPASVGPNLYVKGFPGPSPTELVRPLSIDDTRKTLDGFIPAGDALNKLRRRRSPSVTVPVVTVVGRMEAGDSGAPIIDSTGAVAAMGNGGLLQIRDVGWGFALETLQYVKYGDASGELRNLEADTEANPELYAYVISPIRPAALHPTISAAVVMNQAAPEAQLTLNLPFEVVNQRLAATFAGGLIGRTSTHTFDTLPGVPASEFVDDRGHGYFQIGVSYHPTHLPRTEFDPYVRAAVGLIDGNSKYPIITGGVGLDLLIGDRAIGFAELAGQRETVPDATLAFNRYGDSTLISFTSTVVRPRVLVGIRVSLKLWSNQ